MEYWRSKSRSKSRSKKKSILKYLVQLKTLVHSRCQLPYKLTEGKHGRSGIAEHGNWESIKKKLMVAVMQCFACWPPSYSIEKVEVTNQKPETSMSGCALSTSHRNYGGMSDLCVSNQLRLEGCFTDAVIKIQDVEFQIHKIILCNCSPYFRWNNIPGTRW